MPRDPFLTFFTAFIAAGKRAIRKKIDQREEEEKRIVRGASNYLPEELVIENILTKLPVRSLAVCCSVSNQWYNSILHDSRFHLIHNIQNKDKPYLVLNLLNASRGRRRPEMTYFFTLLGREKTDMRILSALNNMKRIYELVGYCNGLACMKPVNGPDYTHGLITVVNPNRGETLFLPYLIPTGGYIFLCHGFGFDSSSGVYKVVIVFASEANDEFLCMVLALGTMQWRKIHTSIFDISPPLGSSPFPSRMVTRVSRTLCRQATFCGGDLFWRTKNKVRNSNDIEMLLSFDLRNEKIHFIRLPTECTLTTPTNERQNLRDDHLLEFKGYPCVARFERITRSNNQCCGHDCNYHHSVCCCYKLHMYLLQDKEKQIWTKEETFNIHIKDQATPLCWYFDTSTVMPPTRILTFSNQVLLYWFNGKRLIFYNLEEKRHLKVVECSRPYPRIFRAKMNKDLERYVGDDDNIYCPSMDYQLNAQVENLVSVTTFIPRDAKTSKSHCADELIHLYRNNPEVGWLTTGRRKPTFYVFC